MGLWNKLGFGQKSIESEEAASAKLSVEQQKLIPDLGSYVAETTVDGKWVVVNAFGVHLLADVLEESVPWYAVERMTFAGKQRVLQIWWTNREAPMVKLELESHDPEEFMITARGYLERSLVLVRKRKVSGGSLDGSVRRDSDGELFVVISTSKPDLVVSPDVIANFEQELIEMAGLSGEG